MTPNVHPPLCLNCDTPLSGAYCSGCGQKALADDDRGLVGWLGVILLLAVGHLVVYRTVQFLVVFALT